MIGRVVEIAESGRHLSVSRGFMVVSEGAAELGRVPLDDIGVVVCHAYGATFSNNLVTALAERGAVMVLCGPNHLPVAWMWPAMGHYLQSARMRQQIAASAPLRKRLWQGLVQAKIRHQAAVLAALGRPSNGVRQLAEMVRSGDPGNVEAQAARRYWPLLMGEKFHRDQTQDGANALLNYGYAILRAAVARAICAAGLHPSLGLHHRNPTDQFCLVDDVIEPFRPLADAAVAAIIAADPDATVTPETKKRLAGVLAWDMRTDAGITPVDSCILRLAASLAESFESGRVQLDFPAELRDPPLR